MRVRTAIKRRDTHVEQVPFFFRADEMERSQICRNGAALVFVNSILVIAFNRYFRHGHNSKVVKYKQYTENYLAIIHYVQTKVFTLLCSFPVILRSILYLIFVCLNIVLIPLDLYIILNTSPAGWSTLPLY